MDTTLRKVKVTKIEGDTGLFLGYEVKGFLTSKVVEGESLKVLRTHRNGLEILGFFETSEVKSIKQVEDFLVVETENSSYRIEDD